MPLIARHQHSTCVIHLKQENRCFGAAGSRYRLCRTGARALCVRAARTSEQADTPICPRCSLAKVLLGFLHWLISPELCPPATVTHSHWWVQPPENQTWQIFSLPQLHNPSSSQLLSSICPAPQPGQCGWSRRLPSPEFLEVLMLSSKKANKERGTFGQNRTIPSYHSGKMSSPYRSGEDPMSRPEPYSQELLRANLSHRLKTWKNFLLFQSSSYSFQLFPASTW